MDTTSHNFSWDITYLGDGASSILRDVCIINDTTVLAVGEIYKKDSLGNWETDAYNVAKWNGKKWELVRVPTKIWSTNSFMFAPLQAIFAFDINNICVTTGGQVIWYNGQSWGQWQFLFNDLGDTTFGGINKFWGTSKSNLYGVGNKGNIFHFNGVSWRRLESGTDKNIHDIYGLGEEYIYLIGSNNTPSEEIKFMQFKNNNVLNLSTAGLPWSMSTIWFPRPHRIYIGGDGVHYKDLRIDQSWRDIGSSFTHYYTGSIRGNDLNDVCVVTHFGGFYHFNGSLWKSYNLSLSTGVFLRVEIKMNIAVGVGTLGGKYAFAVIAKRY
jgi:hypothetical protein